MSRLATAPTSLEREASGTIAAPEAVAATAKSERIAVSLTMVRSVVIKRGCERKERKILSCAESSTKKMELESLQEACLLGFIPESKSLLSHV